MFEIGLYYVGGYEDSSRFIKGIINPIDKLVNITNGEIPYMKLTNKIHPVIEIKNPVEELVELNSNQYTLKGFFDSNPPRHKSVEDLLPFYDISTEVSCNIGESFGIEGIDNTPLRLTLVTNMLSKGLKDLPAYAENVVVLNEDTRTDEALSMLKEIKERKPEMSLTIIFKEEDTLKVMDLLDKFSDISFEDIL